MSLHLLSGVRSIIGDSENDVSESSSIIPSKRPYSNTDQDTVRLTNSPQQRQKNI